MGLIRLTGFAGMWPARDPRALPENAALDAANIRVEGGGYLKGSLNGALVKTLAAATKAVFRIPLAGANTLANSYWMEFADADTDVVRSPLVNDSFERIYWASPSTGLKYAPKATIIAGGIGFDGGVPAPITAPSLTVVAGTGNIVNGQNTGQRVTRDYVVTFINVYGEESQPGPAVEGTGAVDQDWLLTNIPQPGSPGARASYQTIRVYRTVTNSSGVASFFKVVDLAVGTTFYTDRLSDVFVTGQVSLEAVNFAPPPAGMQGLVSMPNGIFVGWKDNTLYFSENFRPHAWPPEYAIAVDFAIVGLAVFGNNCVVLTSGNPYVVSGVNASALSLTKLGRVLPCLSRRSIVATLQGVIYASEEGLVVIMSGDAQVVTSELITREQWRTQYLPSAIKAMMIEGDYIAITGTAPDGFRFQPAEPSKRGVSKIERDTIHVSYVGVEPWTGKPYYIGSDNKLYEWEQPGAGAMSYRWASPEYVLPYPTNFGVAQCFFDGGGTLHMKAWCYLRGNDGTVTKTLVYNQDVVKSGREFRLPSGFKGEVWQFEFSGTAELQSALIATTARELRNG